MFITVVNMFKRSVNGHIFRGKYRLVKPVSLKSMKSLIREYELQENNMLLLRNPYLSVVSVFVGMNGICWFLS